MGTEHFDNVAQWADEVEAALRAFHAGDPEPLEKILQGNGDIEIKIVHRLFELNALFETGF